MRNRTAQQRSGLKPGDWLGDRYRIVGQIGEGGSGRVYLAEDDRLPGSRWAIKEIGELDGPGGSPASGGAKEEAALLAGLHHPRLPRMVDFWTASGAGERAYLVMDYVEGTTLAARLAAAGGVLPGEEVADIGRQLLEVLDYLHGQRPPVIYRDLKPSNMMWVPGQGVMLIDFGTARSFKAGAQEDTVQLGTVGFAAPEQYAGGQTDARSDLYGLGALLLYLSTGGRHSQWTGGMERRLAGRLPAEWVPVLRRLLRHRPEDRYASAAEVLEAIGPEGARRREGGGYGPASDGAGRARAFAAFRGAERPRKAAGARAGRESAGATAAADRAEAAAEGSRGAARVSGREAEPRSSRVSGSFRSPRSFLAGRLRPGKAAPAAPAAAPPPLRIGLLGAAPGIGVTHASLALCALLSRRGPTLWVDDRPESAVLNVIAEWAAGDDAPPPEPAELPLGPVRLGGVDYARRADSGAGLPVDDGYAYTVVDFGSAPGSAAPEVLGRMETCGLRLLLAPGADWRLGESLRWLRRQLRQGGAARQVVALPLGTPRAAALLARALGAPVLVLPPQSDPFRRRGELEAALERLLRREGGLTARSGERR